MVFFDLNIPFHESVDQKMGEKGVRLRLVVKAMELGYTGIAFNNLIKGAMSDFDRCKIPLYPLSSLLKVAPALSIGVRFHRELLGVPLDSPFRQYTRLTVAIDNVVHASALNSGNPILKSYDLVAVRPLNQMTFDHVCKVSEVDLISIDFSQNLPFRLKLPMIKAAIERGVYFEITYSQLLSDAHTRRTMVSSSKLLVDWTRGNNLIFSSAAPTANELRGPYDVANLSTLLGLSIERAKTAISKNCRSLIANALRKKQFYKEAIKIENISNNQQLNSKGDWFGECHGWDAISSGEGDVSLDDIGKLFSTSQNTPKSSSGINVIPVADEMPPRILNLKEKFSINGHSFQSLDTIPFFFGAVETGSPGTIDKNLQESDVFDVVPMEDGLMSVDTPSKSQISGSEDGLMIPVGEPKLSINISGGNQILCSKGDQIFQIDDLTFIPEDKVLEPRSICDPVLSISKGIVVATTPKKAYETAQSNNPLLLGSEVNSLLIEESLTVLSTLDSDPLAVSNEAQEQSNCPAVSVGTPSYVTASFDESMKPSNVVANMMDISYNSKDDIGISDAPGENIAASDMPSDAIVTEIKNQDEQDVTAVCSISMQEDFSKMELLRGSDAVSLIDGIVLEQAFDEIEEIEPGNTVSDVGGTILKGISEMKEIKDVAGVQRISGARKHKSRPGKGKHKRKLLYSSHTRPFLRMLKPATFKRRLLRRKHALED